ncbi:hypothetical protein POM88_028430 [Heracleum sosnowskyi]|uniref:Uncharacterized protein n=1 Tax=Heracleum sosnowskyi TaxID=360622 RepID=A0AAD8HTK5_9APIA|nr:hypothetical protein POM88_028430 [Heracleum sosnowskyi]
MVEFLELIQYSDTIEMAKLNKKNVRREWSYLFDALQKVFLCRKTGCYQISHITVKLAYSLAYNQQINVGAIITRELAQRLGKTPRGRGNEIFYPRFIQCILKHLDNKLHEVEGIDTSKLDYPKSMSKIIFGTLDTRNQVDVVLSVTEHMQETFKTYTLDQPIYRTLSWKGKAKADGATKSNLSLPNPSSQPSTNTTLVTREPSAPTSQKVVVTKKKSKKRAIFVTDDSVDLGSEEPESQLTRQKKKSKQIATIESSQQDSDVIKGGEFPKSNLNPTSLSESHNADISSLHGSHSHDNPVFDHSKFESMNEPISSDMVHDTVLTTQDIHSVGQEMHVGEYFNDTNKNRKASPVFTGYSVPNSPILRDLELPSQAHRDDVVTHPILMETPSYSTTIPRLEETQIPFIPVVELSSTTEVPSTSSNLAQATLSQCLGEDYLTNLGSNAKSLSPAEVYDTVNEVYKNQLKALHYLGNGPQSEISSIKEETYQSLTKLKNTYLSDFPKVDGIQKEVQKTAQQVTKMDCTLALVTDNLKKLSTKLENQVQSNINSNSMISIMWKNQYGDKLVDEVPLSERHISRPICKH